MKVRFKIVGKIPGDLTKYEFAGTITNPRNTVADFANLFRDYFAAACRQEWPELPENQQPTAKQITVTFTLP